MRKSCSKHHKGAEKYGKCDDAELHGNMQKNTDRNNLQTLFIIVDLAPQKVYGFTGGKATAGGDGGYDSSL